MPRYEFPSPLTLERLEQILRNHPAFTDPRFPVAQTTITLNPEQHSDRDIVLNHAGGVTVTLPKANGTGDRYRVTVGVLATANSHIVKCGSTSDVITGSIWQSDTDTAGTTTAFSSGTTSDTITMNRSTSGSVLKGEWLELQDVANNTWSVRGFLANTGSGITPFGSTVN